MIKQATKTRKSQRELTILRRYAISKGKMAGSICNVVRSTKMVKGQQVSHDYQVWKYRIGRMSCDCPATTPYCKHIDLVEIEEMRRCDYVAPAKVRKSAVHVTQPEVTAQPVIETTTTKEVESKRRVIAPLNGNRGFQLCKSWAEIEAERAAKKQAESKVA